jgi:uncharacterized protein (DUF58 family)
MQQGHAWSGSGLPWPIRETAQGRSGALNSQQQGSGIDFAETRTYQPGDEPRHINWRATARTGTPMVRIFHEDLAPTACFLIDRRASMRFGTHVRLKATQAARLAIFLATWEARRGAELGGLILNETPHWIPPVSGQTGIHNLISLATAPCPPMDQITPLDLNKTLSRLSEQLPAGSHVYLLSDLYDLDENSLPRLYRLGKQHRVWAMSIFDPAEYELPQAGQLRLIWDNNIETSVNSSHKTIREQSRTRFQDQQASIKKLCERADISYSSIATNTDNLAS